MIRLIRWTSSLFRRRGAVALAAMVSATVVASPAFAHISYTGRDFGTVTTTGSSIAGQLVSSGFGWADATDADWGDSHRFRYFRFNVASGTSVQITVARNAAGTGSNGTFLPGFSLFSGLAQRANNEGVWQTLESGSTYRTEALAHDSAALSVQSLVDQFGSGNGSGLGGSGKEGSFRSLANWSIGNDPTYVTAGNPSSGILIEPRLASFTYIGHAADGTSANFGNAAGILGDGNADGFVTATFADLAPGDYSLFVGGANYGLQSTETGPSFPTYGVNVTVQAVPEPGACVLAAIGVGAAGWTCLRRRRAAAALGAARTAEDAAEEIVP
jgi:hypothetical protein